MQRYILKRLLVSIVVFISITFLVFVMSNLAPGGPLDLLAADANLSNEAYEQLKISLGLDKPIVVRYGLWLIDFFHGDLGPFC